MPHSERLSADLSHASTNKLPYWLVNLPQSEWPDDPNSCPDFLSDLSGKDIATLSIPDEVFQVQTWEEVKRTIKQGEVDLFKRVPSDLRRYLAFVQRLKVEYGSILDFMITERLKWTTLSPKSSIMLEDPADYKVLYNDWPYGIDNDVTHLVVWTKFRIAENPTTGEVADSERAIVDNFVYRTFCQPVGVSQERVLWFKNPSSLKSVHSIEHFHVVLYKASEKLISTVTHGDVPWSKRP